MRRALLLAVLAAPALAQAQTVAPGAILFTKNNGQDLIRGPFINAAECPDTSGAHLIYLSWNTTLFSGGLPPSSQYQVWVSNKQHPGTSPNPCTTQPNGTDTFAGSVGDPIIATFQTQNLVPYNTGDFITALQGSTVKCDVTADTPIYVCVLATSGGAAVGYALGTLTLSTSSPGAPGGVTAEPADDGALQIGWSRPTSGVAAYDYVVTVTGQQVDTTPRIFSDIIALSYLVSGLTNNNVYDIGVVARSQAGNPSPAATTTAIPVNVQNFWDIYHDAPPNGFGGQEKGGCSTAGAGPAALLAVAALLAKLRRRA